MHINRFWNFLQRCCSRCRQQAPLRNKGPPARGLIWLKREQLKRMSKSYDVVAESEEDYEPSEQSSEDEDCSSEFQQTDSEDSTNRSDFDHTADATELVCTQLNEWHNVQDLQKHFKWVKSESVQSSVPDEMHKAVDFF